MKTKKEKTEAKSQSKPSKLRQTKLLKRSVARPTTPATKPVQVAIIESERGWGRKIDEIKTFDTREKALAFIKEYNSYNTSPTAPDWYMQAELME